PARPPGAGDGEQSQARRHHRRLFHRPLHGPDTESAPRLTPLDDVAASEVGRQPYHRVLMRRLGHASPAASYRYLHAVDGRDAEIASALSAFAAHGDAAKLPRSVVVKH